MIDGVETQTLRFKSVLDGDVRLVDGLTPQLGRWLGDRAALNDEGRPLIEGVRSVDGRSLDGYLRNAALPDLLDGHAPTELVEPSALAIGWTVASFERACTNVGLGAAYRDVLFALLAKGNRAEACSLGVQVCRGSDGARTLFVFELAAGPTLTCTLQLEAFDSGLRGVKTMSVSPCESADSVVREVEALTGQLE